MCATHSQEREMLHSLTTAATMQNVERQLQIADNLHAVIHCLHTCVNECVGEVHHHEA